MTDGRPGGSRHGSPAGTTAALSPATSAERYWRVACGLASAHLFGWPWPPGASGARRRVVGHWGCNPGIAWIAGHVAARSDTVEPVQVVLGTGHASSYLFAQLAIAEQRTPEEIAAACARYGMPGGDPAELLGERDVLVRPASVEQYAERACRAGSPVEVRRYPEADHGSIVALAWADAGRWSAERRAGRTLDRPC